MKNLIHREERELFLLLGIFLIIISATNTLVQISGDALFISNIGITRLPFMYIVSALVLAVMAIVVIPVIDRIHRIKIYNITAGLLAMLLLSCWGLVLLKINWTYYLIYVVTYILEAFLFLEFWLIAGDICHTRQAKRIFPIILGGSLIAGAGTAFLTKFLAPVLPIRNLLFISGLLCLITVPLSRRLSRFFEPRGDCQQKIGKFFKEISILNRLSLDLKIIWQSKLVKLLSLSFILYTVLSFILEYKFNQAASLYFTVNGKVVTERLAGFYGLIKGWIVIGAICLQFFFCRRIINRAGVCNTYILMPFVFLLGFFGIYLAKIFQGAALYLFFYAGTSARFSHKAVAGSLYRSSGELLYNAIPTEKRGRVRAFHSALVEPMGIALAGGVIMLACRFSLPLAIVFSFIYIIIVGIGLKKNYLSSIIEMLKEKSGRLWETMSGTFGQYGTREILGLLQNSLKDSDPDIRTFAYEIISQTRDKDTKSLFESALTENFFTIKRIAIKALGDIGDKDTINLIEPFLNDKDFRIRAQAISTTWLLGGEKEKLKIRENVNYLLKLFERRDNRLSNLISSTLSDMGEIALDSIKKFLPGSDIYSCYFLFKALDGMARQGVNVCLTQGIRREEIIEVISRLVKQCYYHLYVIEKFKSSPMATLLLRDTLLEENRKVEFNVICGLKLLDKNSERMNIISKNLRHPDAFVRSNAIEALEHIGEPEIASPLIALLENKTEFDFPDVDISGVLETFIKSKHKWLCASAIFTIGELKLTKFKDRLLHLLKDKDSLIRANSLEALLKMGHRFSPDLLQSLKNDPSALVKKYIDIYKVSRR